MEDLMLIEFLKHVGQNITDHEFMMKFKEFMESDSEHHDLENEKPAHEIFASHKGDTNPEHFNEPYARYLVSKMYHHEGDKKCMGEMISMEKVQMVHAKYKDSIPYNVTASDIYLALNAQYHDYAVLYKSWFGENIEQCIISSGMMFWFQDDDYKAGCKLWNYFKVF